MPKVRNQENQGLPRRWTYRNSAYYFQVPRGQESHWDNKKLFRLGKTLPEAQKAWVERKSEPSEKPKLVGQMLDRYAFEVIPKKAVTTQKRELRDIKMLKSVFDKMPIEKFEPMHAYEYVDRRSKKKIIMEGKQKVRHGGPSAARHELGTLSHAFTCAIRWGCIKQHPFKGQLQLETLPPRTRYVEDWEIVECLSIKSKRKKGSVKIIQAYIRIKLLMGLSKSDLLRLNPEQQFKEDGIHTLRHKTAKRVGKGTIYEWTPELRFAIKDAMDVRPVKDASFLFCNKFGLGYIDEQTGESSGWDSMWQRFMGRVLTETKVTHNFTEHDLRAKCASDADSLEHARALLSHVDARTTNRIYRRKAERVRPASLKWNNTNGIYNTVSHNSTIQVPEKWWLERDLNPRPRDYDLHAASEYSLKISVTYSVRIILSTARKRII